MTSNQSPVPPDGPGLDLPALGLYIDAIQANDATSHLVSHNYAAVFDFIRHLGGLTDLAALRQLAADPNTPPEALVFLAGICPAEFCANPVLPLLLLENPNLPAEFEPASLGRLLSYAGAPADLLAAIAAQGQPDSALAARLHVALGGEAGPAWRAELDVAVLQLPSLPDDDLLVALLILGAVPAWLHPRVAAAGPRLAQALAHASGERADLAPLAAALSPRAVAKAPPAPRSPAELLQMAEDESPRRRAEAAAHPDAPPALLARMKEAEDWSDCDLDVYQAIARNPNTPAETLVLLAGHSSALYTGVRRGVVQNPSTPPAALALLADEAYAPDIRLALAAHPNLAPAQRAQLRASSLEAARATADPIYRAVALAQPEAGPGELRAAARSPHWLERLAVALRPDAPPELYGALGEDGNRLVRAAARERLAAIRP